MCRSKMAIDAENPTSTLRSPRPARPARTPTPSSSSTSGSTASSTYKTSISTATSLSSLRDSLPENPNIYDFSEIRSATNNFLSKPYASSSTTVAWRCKLRGKDAIVFQRKLRRPIQDHELARRLSAICRSHHTSIIKLLGISVSSSQIYLAYEFIAGSNLSNCLRNSRNPNFTVLSSWMSRIQIAADVAHGLDYIHNNTGLSVNLVHNHIKSSGIIVTEPSFNAKICHFGTSTLTGEIDSKTTQFAGVRGYMSPEFQLSGIASLKSDIFAFGVVLLELFSGEEPLSFRFDKSGGFERISVIDTAKSAIDGGEGRLRMWIDRRMKDSFPVDVAEKMIRLALECVAEDPEDRPDMQRTAGKISKLYLESRSWNDNLKLPTTTSISLAPR